jgi:hypothetical protein
MSDIQGIVIKITSVKNNIPPVIKIDGKAVKL